MTHAPTRRTRTPSTAPQRLPERRAKRLPYLDFRPDPELLGLYEENSNSAKIRAMGAAAREALSRLTERQREAVMLHHFSGLTQREIAAMWGVTPSAVCHLLERAYAAMRRLIVVT